MKRAALVLSLFLFAGAAHAAPAIEHVNKTNALRCGYVEYAPAITKDLKTGQWSGFDYEIVQALSDRLQLKPEFTVPTGWATVVADLDAKKFDMLCTGFWVHPNVGKFAYFSRPIFYQPILLVTRADEMRINSKADLNDAKLKMVALDGDNPVYIAKVDFPKAQTLILPNMTDFSQVLVNVVNKKADFTFVDGYTFGTYNMNNPGKLKVVAPEDPVRIYPVSYVFGKEDSLLRDAVNAALDEMILDGTLSRIMNKFAIYPNTYYNAEITYKK